MTEDQISQEPDPHPSGARRTEPTELGRVLLNERRRTLTMQQKLSTATGIRQPNISAYERGRRTPSWETFVRLLAAMNRQPVITTEELRPTAALHQPHELLDSAIRAVLQLLGDRQHRIEGDAARHVLGDREAPTDYLRVSAVGDPDRLDELAIAVSDQVRWATTTRGGGHTPQVAFHWFDVAVVISVITRSRPAVEVDYRGLAVRVAPMPEAVERSAAG